MIGSIFVILSIVFVYTVLKRKHLDTNCETKRANHRYRKGKTGMNEKEKTITHITPSTERSVSGCNWKTFKDIVSKVSTSKKRKDASNKNTSNKSQKFKKSQNNTETKMTNTKHDIRNSNNIEKHKQLVTKHIAIDCEMVGIGDGTESMLARVSIVNRYGYCLYDKYVKPREQVQDYRTAVSGIEPHHLKNGEDFAVVQKEVAEILKGRILVGHALKNDLSVLYLSHPWRYLRDTSRYKPFRQVSNMRTPSLKKLALELLGIEIQSGQHDSIEDARTAMQLYMLYRNKWESEILWR